MRLNDVTIYHIRSNSALRTPRYYGQFALSLGKDSSYELSWGWSREVTPHAKEMFLKNIHEKGRYMGKFRASWVLSVLFTPLGEMISLMKYPLSRQLYFASVFLTWVSCLTLKFGALNRKMSLQKFPRMTEKGYNAYILRFCFKYTLAF